MRKIEFDSVVKRYNDRLAVDSLTFSIEAGSLYGLLGPNGAGKTTLIGMLCGITTMDKGDIRVGGFSILSHPRKVKEAIGYVPQELALFDNMTIKQNLDYFAGLYGLMGKLKKERIKEALELTGLAHRQKEKVKKLSGGMKRRLNIACAILHHPEVLIMDEPTVGIDPQSRNHILEFTRAMNKERGTTIIYTSHYMEEIQSLCDQLLILDEGKEIIKGTKEQVLRSVVDEVAMDFKIQQMHEELFIELNRIAGVKDATYTEGVLSLVVDQKNYVLHDILNVLSTGGINIQNIAINEPNLETVFLSLTGRQLRD